jgi:23S rRNA maturation mini-RNase III
VEYRRATGLECLYGYFWLSAQYDRARELFLRGVE